MSSNARTPEPGLGAGRTPQDGADAGGQLVGVERLGDVVVGAEVEALGLVGGRALGRQQDDGDRAPLAELAHDLDAVEVGHDDVEQDDVRPDLLGLLEGLLAAVGGDDAEALLTEGDRDELGDAGFVVGDEDEGLGAHWHLLGRCHGDGQVSEGSAPAALGGPPGPGGLRRRQGRRSGARR